MINKSTCSIDGCQKKAEKRGWCGMHYYRWKTHSDFGPPPSQKNDPLVNALGHVDFTKSECWLWTGATGPGGYGRVAIRHGKTSCYWAAHRLMYSLLREDIPEGLVVDHLCRVRNCVNPWHLEVVTQRENLLRGEGVAAEHAAKTHCPQGHPYSGDNLFLHKKRYGYSRECRICKRARERRRVRA